MSCNFSQEGHAQTVQFLRDKGAVINTQDKNGRTGNVGMSFLFWILVFISKFYCYLVNSVADFNKMRGTLTPRHSKHCKFAQVKEISKELLCTKRQSLFVKGKGKEDPGLVI